jgi:hypothetical protein
VEWFWQGKTEVPVEKPLPATVCLLHVQHGLAWDWTPASMMKGQQLNAWAMTQPTTAMLSFMFSDVTPCGLVAAWHYIPPKKRWQLSIICSLYLLLLICSLCSRWQHCCIAMHQQCHTSTVPLTAVLSSVIKNAVCRNCSHSWRIIMERFWCTLMAHGRFYCNLFRRNVQTQGLTDMTSCLCRVVAVLSVGHSISCSSSLLTPHDCIMHCRVLF